MAETVATPRWPLRTALVTLAAAALVLAAGPLMTAGLPWWIGLPVFALGAVVAGIGGLATAFFLLSHRGPHRLLLGALVAGVLAALIPAGLYFATRGAPSIHDITTDTADPPQFSAVLAENGETAGDAAYEGADIAAQQRVAYPALAGVLLSQTPRAAFDRALTAARAMEWRIVAADPAQGRIEAVATVPWWGFQDDVVVRVRPDGNGSRIDVRSRSRIRGGDYGVNAKRIRDYLARLG